MKRLNCKLTRKALFLAAAIALHSSGVIADQLGFNGRIGVVNAEKVFADSNLAKASQVKLKSEFAAREKELREATQKIKGDAERLDRDAGSMSEVERVRKQRELADADRDLQRKQQKFTEDVQERSREEREKIALKANEALKIVGQRYKLDAIIQEAAYINPKADVTAEVIAELNNLR
ncbi:MAG: OmpH family outer membrane protein [Rhodoferax sp.]|nr:MAG: OmpH family outer membrane protein [Rhodoferax sp.]